MRRIIAVSSNAFPAENRGLSTVINGDKKADGSISIGMVMPDKTPNSSIAVSYPLPDCIKIRGIITMFAEEISRPNRVDNETGTATAAISRRMRSVGISSAPSSLFLRCRYSRVKKPALMISLKIIAQTIRAAA